MGTAPIQISIYDDHLEIWNEGGLVAELTLEDLKRKHASKPRNPKIANVFFRAGFIELWGRGTIKMINECKSLGFGEPKFQVLQGGFHVRIDKTSQLSENKLKELGLNGRQIKGVLFAQGNGKITNQNYQELGNVSRATAFRDLVELTEKWKILKKHGTTGASTYYTVNDSNAS